MLLLFFIKYSEGLEKSMIFFIYFLYLQLSDQFAQPELSHQNNEFKH